MDKTRVPKRFEAKVAPWILGLVLLAALPTRAEAVTTLDPTLVPQIQQRFSPPEPSGATIDTGTYDCVPASVAMVLQTLRKEGLVQQGQVDYPSIRRAFRAQSPNAKAGISPTLISAVVAAATAGEVRPQLGLVAGDHWQDVVNGQLSVGYPVIAFIPDWRRLVAERGYKDPEPHTVVITQIKNGLVSYDDPWPTENKPYSMGVQEFGEAWLNGGQVTSIWLAIFSTSANTGLAARAIANVPPGSSTAVPTSIVSTSVSPPRGQSLASEVKIRALDYLLTQLNSTTTPDFATNDFGVRKLVSKVTFGLESFPKTTITAGQTVGQDRDLLKVQWSYGEQSDGKGDLFRGYAELKGFQMSDRESTSFSPAQVANGMQATGDATLKYIYRYSIVSSRTDQPPPDPSGAQRSDWINGVYSVHLELQNNMWKAVGKGPLSTFPVEYMCAPYYFYLSNCFEFLNGAYAPYKNPRTR